MATAVNKDHIRTFEAEIGPQNRTLRLVKILLVLKKSVYLTENILYMDHSCTLDISVVCA